MSDETSSASTGYLRALLGLLQKCTPYAGGLGAPHGEGSPPDDETDLQEGAAPSEERRVILRSEEEAAGGRVTAVQAALRSGWELTDIELRQGPGQGSRLAFVLQRSGRPSGPAVG